MSTTALLTPIVDGAIRSIKFFNGRLLTGEDLTTEQTANREARNRVGVAVGDGVVSGLEVSINQAVTSPPTVTVQPGLAVNRHGKPLRLSAPVDVTLVQSASSATTAPAPQPGGFAVCLPPSTTAYVSDGNVYVLTLAPVQTTEGRTQISNLGSGADACNTKYLVDAVELRLVQLKLTAADLATPALVQNVVASKLFGYANAVAFATNPFGAQAPAGSPLDALTAGQLLASEVPLATLYWTKAGGLVYVDMWSVRRTVAGPRGAAPWESRLDPSHAERARAMLLQFQEQLDDLRKAPSPASATAATSFRYLPPAGLLPINNAQGFVTATFFGSVTLCDPIYVEGSKVESLLRVSLGYPPIDLQSPQMVFVYHVFENALALTGASPPVEYVVFASGQVPYFGDARYDVSHWDYASYA
jgi:hypothetical protein